MYPYPRNRNNKIPFNRGANMSYQIRQPHIAAFGLCLALALANTAIAQSKSPVAPTEQAYNNIVKQAYVNFKDDTSGKNADYIPALAKVDSKLYGIAIVTTDGRVYKIGDVDQAFSIQSISKVFTLALPWKNLEPTRSSIKLAMSLPDGLSTQFPRSSTCPLMLATHMSTPARSPRQA
jgi:hypothetical protein